MLTSTGASPKIMVSKRTRVAIHGRTLRVLVNIIYENPGLAEEAILRTNIGRSVCPRRFLREAFERDQWRQSPAPNANGGRTRDKGVRSLVRRAIRLTKKCPRPRFWS